MSTETIMQFATPVAMIVLIVIQKRDAARLATKVAVTNEKRDHQLQNIHQLVNSEMTKAQQKIDEQRDEITALRLLLTKKKRK